MLFLSLKEYISCKIKCFKTTYLFDSSIVVNCIAEIKKIKNIHALKKLLNCCEKKKLCSVNNFYILIFFIEYIEKYFYNIESFNELILTDFLFIATSVKSASTANRYKKTVLSFANFFNTKRNKSIICLNCYKYYETKYYYNDVALSEKEVKKLLKDIYIYPRHKNIYRDCLIIEILLRTGIRVTELLFIQAKDIKIEKDEDFCFINIRGKNNLHRVVLLRYSVHKRNLDELLGSEKKWLFTNSKGEQLNRQFVYNLIRKLLKFSGIVKLKNGPHLLRHTYATHLYKKHRDIILLQEALGHQSMQTSTKYIHIRDEYKKAMLELWDDFLIV